MRIVFRVLRNAQTARGVPGLLEVQIVREIEDKDQKTVVWTSMSRDVGSFSATGGHGGGQLIGECTLYAPYAIRCRDRGAGLVLGSY